ncbi:MAG TPA: kelch repeat-containing protein [Rudaea sp.]|nr:kelch repeat-containing protein [Rudaea sp.]
MNLPEISVAASRTSVRGNLRLHPLAACLVLPFALADLSCNSALAATLSVTNCNDAGGGSLRAALAIAHNGDSIDLSPLTCGKITLTTGQLVVAVDNLTLQGPGAAALTIAGSEVPNHEYSLLYHTGTGTLRIDALKITDNHAAYHFGGFSGCIASKQGTVYLNRSLVTECSRGGVLAKGFSSRDSTISNNYQGVITTGGNVSINSSTISGNFSYACAGMHLGVSDYYGPVTTATGLISNSTISGNVAYSYYSHHSHAGAGCIYQPTTISNTTIAFNEADDTGGLFIYTTGDVRIDSTIIANNTNPGLTKGQYNLFIGLAKTVSGSHNLVMSPSPTNVDVFGINADPLLLPLADNGGPTQTHALMPGSPAIDAGSNPAGLATDQRGAPFARVVGAAPDIGAFESRPSAVNIDASFTGSWFDPAQSGHGLMLEVLSDHRLLALWFAFNPLGTEQSWFGGVGTYGGDTAVITDVALPTGGKWIPNFDPNKIVREPWGTLTFTFTDHDHGKVSFNSVLGYGSGSMNLLRLTNVAKQTALRPIGSPGAVTADTSGNVYFSSSPNLIFKLDPQGMLRRIAGTGASGYSGDGGPATQAQLNFPLSYPELVDDPIDYAPLVGGLAVDTAGRVYVADAYNNRVRRIDTNGIISTVAGTGAAGFTGDGGLATNAQIHWPQGVAVDSLNNFYFTTAFASLRKVTPAGVISTLAGSNCGSGYLGPGLCLPEQIAVDAANNIFVPDSYCRVREVRHDGAIFTVAGADNVPNNGLAFTCGYSGDGGPATKAALDGPYGVAVDKAGNLYIADSANNCIRKVNAAGTIATVAGVCNPTQGGYSGDGGPATGARLNLPYGVTVDGADNLLIADTDNHRIRKVSNGIISTIAGSGAGLNSIWTPSGNLTTARVNHTATLLANGNVLVAGGAVNTTAELYDPATRGWTPTGSLGTARSQHTATLLDNGKVLVAGGAGSTCTYTCNVASAELYDPASGTWSATGSMAASRFGHTATLLQNGKVLVAGGYGTDYLASAELYDPATGSWSPTANMSQRRTGHQAVRLQDGKVLVLGGSDDIDDGFFFSSAELYDPDTGTWGATGSMKWPRFTPVATLLQNGRVLVAGGDGFDQVTQGWHTTLSSAEIYDPVSKTFVATNPLLAGQEGFTASALPDGTVLVAGGFSARAPNWPQATFPTATESYDPNSGQWSPAGNLHAARAGHTATVLTDGSVLVAGGSGKIDGSSALTSSETHTSTVTIDASFSGSWFDPAQSGHGLMLEVLSDNRMLALWFAFNPEGNQQSWFGGVGTYSGNTATITDTALPAGGRWIPNFDPDQIVRHPWGKLTLTFSDCNHGRVDFNSVYGYGAGSMNLLRLTQPDGTNCP